MFQVRINGTSSPINGQGLPKITDLIELIKSSIDPSHMIVRLQLNGKELKEQEWQFPPAQFGESDILEVETGLPENFVRERMSLIPAVLENIFILFRGSRQSFQAGDMNEGNRIMVAAVKDLHAFFGWYSSLVRLVPEASRQQYDIGAQVDELTKVCKEICQQQLYQSWWALGNSLEMRLEPALDKLEAHFRKIIRAQ